MWRYISAYCRRPLLLPLLAGLLSLWLAGWAIPLDITGNKALFHILADLVPLLINFTFVCIVWNTTRYCLDRTALILSLSLMANIMYSIAHMLSYPGMPTPFYLTTDAVGLSALYLLLARFSLAIGFVCAVTMPAKACTTAPIRLLHVSMAIFTAGVILAAAVFPITSGVIKQYTGMPGFMKLNMPHVTMLLYGLSALVLYWRRDAPAIGSHLKWALLCQIMAELSLLLYRPAFDLLIFLSHGFSALSGILLVRGLFYNAIDKPYQDIIQIKEEFELLAQSHAAMYEEARQQQALLEDTFARLGNIMSSRLDLDETMTNIIDMAVGMVNARQGILALTCQHADKLQVSAVTGISAPPDFIPLSHSLAGRVLTTKTAQCVDDITACPKLYRPKLLFSTIMSALAAPIMNDNRCLGVLEVYSPATASFDNHDALLLTAIGRHAGAAIAGAMLYEETRLRLTEEQLLLQISQTTAKSLDGDIILAEGTILMRNALCANTAIGFRLRDGMLLPVTNDDLDINLPNLKLEQYPALQTALMKKKPQELSPVTFLPIADLYSMEELLQFKVIPLVVDQRILGAIILGWQKYVNGELLKRDAFTMLMAQQISLGLEKADLYAQIRSMALSDGLTGLANRRNFDMFLRAELRRAASLRRPLSLIMFDLDRFKLFNDKYGHTTGDKLLTQIGVILQAHVRPIDLTARYGGEEFSIILPECSQAEAVSLAEKIRQSVADSHFPDQQDALTATITASLGVATYDPALTPEPPDTTQFIAMADQALYQAKQTGRNKVEAYTAI